MIIYNKIGLFGCLSVTSAVLALAACGSKSGSSTSPAAPAPQQAPVPVATVHTFLASQPVRTASSVQILYTSNVPAATYTCLVTIGGKAGTWQVCPQAGLTLKLSPGVPYSVQIKAISPSGVEDAAGLTVNDSSTAASDPGSPDPAAPTQNAGASVQRLWVTGEDQLRLAKDGKVHLSWNAAQIQGDTVSCSLDQKKADDCTAGYDVDFSILASGIHLVTINAQVATGATVASEQISFCTGSACFGPDAAVPLSFQLGDFYAYTIPDQMHVTEYATNKTANHNLDFFRVMTASDPYYLGNYPCNGPFDHLVKTPGGNAATPLDYCESTPTEDLFKYLTGARIANNHLEVATDPAAVTSENHEYVSINVFDKDYEFMLGRSRFKELCANQRGNIRQAPPMQVIAQDFWTNSVVLSNFMMCTTDLVEASPQGVPTMSPVAWRNSWWVGAFFISVSDLLLPTFECFTNNYAADAADHKPHSYDPQWCGTFHNPSLLEVTFVTKTPYPTPEAFAYAAWNKFGKTLTQIAPTGNGVPPAATPQPATPSVP